MDYADLHRQAGARESTGAHPLTAGLGDADSHQRGRYTVASPPLDDIRYTRAALLPCWRASARCVRGLSRRCLSTGACGCASLLRLPRSLPPRSSTEASAGTSPSPLPMRPRRGGRSRSSSMPSASSQSSSTSRCALLHAAEAALRLYLRRQATERRPPGLRPLAQSWCRCGRGEPSRGADVAGVSPVVVRMWHRHPKARRGVVEADGHADVVACCAWGMEGVSAWLRSHTQRR